MILMNDTVTSKIDVGMHHEWPNTVIHDQPRVILFHTRSNIIGNLLPIGVNLNLNIDK